MAVYSQQMNIQSREKLSDIVLSASKRKGGLRAYARGLGVSLAAVQGWVEQRTVPTTENLQRIAVDAGYTLEELIAYLDGQPLPVPTTRDQVLKQMRQLSRHELAEVLAVGVQLLAAG